MARTLHHKLRFTVEIDGFESASFARCSELSVEAAKIEYHEGGSVIPFKEAGLLTFADVTLERGTSSDKAFHDWMVDVWDVAAGPGADTAGLEGTLFKRDLTIRQIGRDSTTTHRSWNLYQAFPLKYVAGEWDNNANEVVIEQITLTYDRFELQQ